MPGFYRQTTNDETVSQGDIFENVPIVGVSLGSLFQAVADGDTLRAVPVEPDRLTAGMVLLEHIATTKAIVISQSCDAERVPRLMLAPLSAFKLEEKAAQKKWKKINHAATSLGEPKSVYLPGNPALGLARSLADFGEAFTLSREFLQGLARRGKRVAGLGDRAVSYLQFRLATLLTRVAQDDFAWPSREDLEIKIAALTEQVSAAEKSAQTMSREADQSAGDVRDSLLDDVEEGEAVVAGLKSQLDQAKAALGHADDLE